MVYAARLLAEGQGLHLTPSPDSRPGQLANVEGRAIAEPSAGPPLPPIPSTIHRDLAEPAVCQGIIKDLPAFWPLFLAWPEGSGTADGQLIRYRSSTAVQYS